MFLEPFDFRLLQKWRDVFRVVTYDDLVFGENLPAASQPTPNAPPLLRLLRCCGRGCSAVSETSQINFLFTATRGVFCEWFKKAADPTIQAHSVSR